MNRDMIITLSKKIIRAVIAAKFAGVCIKVGRKVYECIPKFDTIEDIDTDLLLKENTTDMEAIDLTLPKDLPELS